MLYRVPIEDCSPASRPRSSSSRSFVPDRSVEDVVWEPDGARVQIKIRCFFEHKFVGNFSSVLFPRSEPGGALLWGIFTPSNPR
jgi:hypothetical protein